MTTPLATAAEPKGPRRSLRRWLLAPAVVTAALLLGALFPRPALRDALTHEPIAEGVARLHFPQAYLVASPLLDLLDALTLLTLSQHVALLVTLLVAFTVRRTVRRRTPARWPVRIARELGAFALSLALLLALYGYGAVGPRPMARLVVGDPQLVTVDFHAHTHASHDGRRGFTAERVREWHRSSGFDVAYVTDHKAWWGAAEGMRANPRLAGEGTIILSGLELRSWWQNVNVLGMTAADSAYVSDIWHLKPGLRLATNGEVPVIMQTIPYELEKFAHEAIDSLNPTIAMELHDAAPKGLRFGQRNRDHLLALIDTADLAVLAGSDNHGWGRTAAAWSVLPVPGWRRMTPTELGEAIEDRIRLRRTDAGRIVERPSPELEGALLPLTLPVMTWNLAATLSMPQRLSWIAWTWGLAGLAWLLAAARRRSGSRAVRAVPRPGRN